MSKGNNYRHGHGDNHIGRSPTWITWMNMKQRCLNPNSPEWNGYGGRGIRVCDRWLRFENFLEDMGEKPTGLTLDRVDNEKGYYKDNCRWASPKTQANNRRRATTTKLSSEQVDEIRWLLAIGCSQTFVSKMFEISMPHINGIAHGRVRRAL